MNYEKFMHQCINLARQGEGRTSPNPLTGCVILDKDFNIISTGYHEKYGENHAERNALLKLTPEQAKGCTLIVNLEPCSHYGKTPPCADLIIKYGIKRVVIGMRDVNPIVNSKGIAKLRNAGIEVIEGVLENECKKLNEVFIKNMQQHKTFTAIKIAATLDGKIAAQNGSSKWITSDFARKEVRNIRKRYDAIMTSSATVLADNPTMEHNKKIILDRELKTDFNAKIYKSGEIFIFCNVDNLTPLKKEKLKNKPDNITIISTSSKDGKLDLDFIFKKLYELGIMSVLIEAGGHLNGSALKYCDKLYHFLAPKILGDNSGLSCFDFRKATDINIANRFEITSTEFFGSDILLTCYPKI